MPANVCRFFISITLIVTVMLTSGFGLLSSAYAEGGQITGRVTDPNGEPMTGVSVMLSVADECSPFSGIPSHRTTDSNGIYTYSGIQAGTYVVSFTKSGYVTSWYKGSATRASATKVAVSATDMITGIDGVLGVGGKIAGQVIDSNGAPIVGAFVMVHSYSGSISAYVSTDADGIYTIGGLETGKYSVHFTKPDYIPVGYPDTATLQSQISVTSPNTTSAVNAVMQIGGKLTGQVTDTGGAPISGVDVRLYSEAEGYYLSSTTSGNDGKYSISGLSAGAYKLYFSSSEYLGSWYGGVTDQSAATPVAITAPGSTTGINQVLRGGGKITGQVTDSNGAPMSGVSVLLVTSESGSYVSWLSTDSSGNYSINGLATGSYKLQFSNSGYIAIWYGGTTDQALAQQLTVTAPDTTAGINMVLGAGGKITGQVTDSKGTPISGVYVQLISSTAGNYLGEFSTNSSGNYAVNGLAVGSYKLQFIKSGYIDVWYGGATDQALATRITVTSPSTNSNVNMVMELGGIITGRVTDSSGLPISGVNVSVTPTTYGCNSYIPRPQMFTSYFLGCGAPEPLNGVTDADGNYTYSGLTTGSYKVSFYKSGYIATSYGATADQASTGSVAVSSPNTTGGIDAVMTIGGKITGQLVDSNGVPVSGASVQLVSSTTGNYFAGESTDFNGNFSITDLPTGSYKLRFEKSGYVSSWYGGAGDQASAALVAVTATATLSGINGVLGVGGKITGQVTDAGGAPISGVSIQLVSSASGNYLAWLTTDSSGNYSISGVATGAYKIMFSNTGYITSWYGGTTDQTAATPVTVTAPDTTAGINHVLGVGGKITGQVTDSNGSPMSGVYVQLVSSVSGYDMSGQSTDSSGKYSISGISTGSYKIRFFKPDYLPSWYGSASDEGAATPVSIASPNTISGINAILISGGKISGRVTDINGKPVSGVYVTVTSADTPAAGQVMPIATISSCPGTIADNGQTNANGEYTYSGLTTGLYKVRFYKSGYDTAWYGEAAARSTATAIAVTAPNTTSGIDVVLKTFIDLFPPTLSITNPPDNMITNKATLNLQGMARDNGSGLKSLTVNDQAVTIDSSGSFTISINLLEGRNTITTVATDNAGNITTDTRSVTFDQAVSYPTGDLDGGGDVNVADALRALQIAVGTVVATTDDLKNGDVAPLINGNPTPDGMINISDAVVILRKSIGVVNW